MGQIETPLEKRLPQRPGKRPTDVYGNLCVALICRKSNRVALGQEDRMCDFGRC